MADISTELQAIMDAVYGEEVRGSIHDAIQKINTINDTGVADINEATAEALSTLNQARSAVNGWPRMALVDYRTKTGQVLITKGPTGQLDIDINCEDTDKGSLSIYGDEDLIRDLNRNLYDLTTKFVNIPVRTVMLFSKACSFTCGDTGRTDIPTYRSGDSYGNPNLITFEDAGFDYYTNVDASGNSQVHFKATMYNYTNETFTDQELFIQWSELVFSFPKSILITNESLREFVERIGAVKIKAGVGESAVIENDIENNTAGGDYAHAEGRLTIASGDYAHAEGTGYDQDNEANNQANIASGYASHAEGYKTEASGTAAHAEGRLTYATANYAHSEGYNNTASGYAAHVEGRQNLASAPKAHAEGTQTTASEDSAHSEGTRTTASGSESHAEGAGTTASGRAAHAEGQATTASGEFSHAEGNQSTASGPDSHAEGIGTIANGRSQHVGGEYNVGDQNNRFIEIQGNGSSQSNRSNARTLDWEGTEWLAKSLELGPNHDTLTPEKVRTIDNIVETLKAVSDTRIVSGPTAEFSDAQAGMPITHLEGEIIFDTEQDGSFTGKTSITLTEQHNEDTPVTHTVTFPEGSSPVFGGYFDFPTGKLYITMISSSMEWGDMQFSIDPDNYLGKRIPLPNCVCGFSGEDKTFCNVTDNYIYDQSASTHFYVYRDDETTGYAVVVLPDTTPEDTVIQVVGTLAEPIVIDLDTYLLVASAGDNSFSVDTGGILKCEYVHDVASQEYEELDERIDAIRQLPAYPTTDGTYILKLIVSDGESTLSWIPEN